jgi:phosphoglycerate dehydrogenase-like enzyme
LVEQRTRVHVENLRPGERGVRLDPDTLEAALAAAALPRDELEISFNEDPEKFDKAAADAQILFAVRRPKNIPPSVQWVQSVSAGVEALVPLLPPGTLLTNASGVHREKGGEFILTAVLMLNYAIPKFVTDKQQKRWQPRFESTLRGKRAILLGVGAIGGEGARLLKLLGASTIGVTRSGSPREFIDRPAQISELDTLLPEADFLISSLPLTADTAGLMDPRRLDLLPRHAGVVIVGRARVFDCGALLAKLRHETLGGAVLDVFPIEPVPPEDTFWTAPNLIMTPHCSVDDHTVYIDRCVQIFIDNLQRFRRGATLRNLVDPIRGY